MPKSIEEPDRWPRFDQKTINLATKKLTGDIPTVGDLISEEAFHEVMKLCWKWYEEHGGNLFPRRFMNHLENRCGQAGVIAEAMRDPNSSIAVYARIKLRMKLEGMMTKAKEPEIVQAEELS